MPGVDLAFAARLELDRNPREQLAVPCGRGAPVLVPGFQERQFPGEDLRLQRVQLAVEADHDVVVLANLPELALAPQGLVKLRVARHDRPAVACRGEVLAGMKAEAAKVPEGAG